MFKIQQANFGMYYYDYICMEIFLDVYLIHVNLDPEVYPEIINTSTPCSVYYSTHPWCEKLG